MYNNYTVFYYEMKKIPESINLLLLLSNPISVFNDGLNRFEQHMSSFYRVVKYLAIGHLDIF